MSFILPGDTCTFNVDAECRSWGNSLPANGTKAKIVGYDEIAYGYTNNCGLEPGIYENRSWLKVKGLDVTVSSCFLDLDKDARDARIKECQDWHAANKNESFRNSPYEGKRLRDLPETPFWPGDIVREVNPSDTFQGKTLCIWRIDYHYMTQKTNSGKSFPAYEVTPLETNLWSSGGWYSSRAAEDLVLVSRGDVWKEYHGEKVSFASLTDEANFAVLLGRHWDIRNPSSHLFSWTLEEALDAIHSGLADSLEVKRGSVLYSRNRTTNTVWKYRDEELGNRIANATLQGFGRPVRGSK